MSKRPVVCSVDILVKKICICDKQFKNNESCYNIKLHFDNCKVAKNASKLNISTVFLLQRNVNNRRERRESQQFWYNSGYSYCRKCRWPFFEFYHRTFSQTSATQYPNLAIKVTENPVVGERSNYATSNVPESSSSSKNTENMQTFRICDGNDFDIQYPFAAHCNDANPSHITFTGFIPFHGSVFSTKCYERHFETAESTCDFHSLESLNKVKQLLKSWNDK